MNIKDFQTVVADALESIYDPSFIDLPHVERQAIIHRVRAAYYSLDESTPSQDIDYAVAAIWAVQMQFNDVVISSEKVALAS